MFKGFDGFVCRECLLFSDPQGGRFMIQFEDKKFHRSSLERLRYCLCLKFLKGLVRRITNWR